ncbi:MAG: hypothetical protein CFE26_23095, partial [Verrucomicrobiales bacterium VVV1]
IFNDADGGDLGGEADDPRRLDGAEGFEPVRAGAEIGDAGAAERVNLGPRFADDDIFGGGSEARQRGVGSEAGFAESLICSWKGTGIRREFRKELKRPGCRAPWRTATGLG